MINAEVTERGTEEYRGDFAREEQLMVELVRRALHQLQFVTQLLRQVFPHGGIEFRVVQTFNNAHFLNGVAFTRLVQVSFVFI